MGLSRIVNLFQRILEPLPLRGKGRLSELIFRFPRVAEAQCHPLPSVTIHVRPGVRIERLMRAGAYERELVALFKRLITPGMVVLDIGANIGYFSTLAAGLVRGAGVVWAFEPSPACYSQLKRNLAAFPWAAASPLAVSDHPGTAAFTFSEHPNQTGWGSLVSHENARMQTAEVQLITLDDWSRQTAIPRVDLIKMDVEGAEYRVLKGASQLLRRFRPVVVAELNRVCLARDSHTPADVLSVLERAGYSNFEFNDGVLAIPEEHQHRIESLANVVLAPLRRAPDEPVPA